MLIIVSSLIVYLFWLKQDQHRALKALKYFSRLGIAISVLLNVSLGGPSNQTFSARNWALKKNNQINLVWFIDGLCDILEIVVNTVLKLTNQHLQVDFSDHCMTSWIYWRSRKDVVYELSTVRET